MSLANFAVTDPLFDWRAERDAAMATVERNAGEVFKLKARAFVLEYLTTHEKATGEELTAACKASGIVAHTDKAMGPVIKWLSAAGRIEVCGSAPRLRGHGCSGGNYWRLTLTTTPSADRIEAGEYPSKS